MLLPPIPVRRLFLLMRIPVVVRMLEGHSIVTPVNETHTNSGIAATRDIHAVALLLLLLLLLLQAIVLVPKLVELLLLLLTAADRELLLANHGHGHALGQDVLVVLLLLLLLLLLLVPKQWRGRGADGAHLSIGQTAVRGMMPTCWAGI